MRLGEQEAIEILRDLFSVADREFGHSEESDEVFNMAVLGLRTVGKLKELGHCHNYQHENSWTVEWIDKVNSIISSL